MPRARNCDRLGAGTAVGWPPLAQRLVLASHSGSPSTREITGSVPSPAIYLHTADSLGASRGQVGHAERFSAVPLTDTSGQLQTTLLSAGRIMDDLDPATAASLDDLAACLQRVHLLADRPTYRTLEQQTIHAGGILPGTRLNRVRLTRSILSDVLLGRKFPSKAFLLTFVEVCGIDLEDDCRWEKAWDRLAIQYRQPSAPPGEVEKLRQENEELRRQLEAVKRQAETAESGTEEEQVDARMAGSQLDITAGHATIVESPPEWERKYITVNPRTKAIDVYDRSIAIQIIQDNIGQSYE